MGVEMDRRGESDIELAGPLEATLTLTLAGEEAEFDVAVVRASARTIVVELASGLSTLAVASAPSCEVVLRGEGVLLRADARPGRRIGDVPDSRQLELVIVDETLDLRDVL